MGFNMNSSLLVGTKLSKVPKIQQFKHNNLNEQYSKLSLLQKLSEFNDRLRFEKQNLQALSEYGKGYYGTDETIIRTYSKFIAAFQDIIVGALDLKKTLSLAIDAALKDIKSCETCTGGFDKSHSLFEREELVRKAVSRYRDVQPLYISNIFPSKYMFDSNFPNPSILVKNDLYSDIEELLIDKHDGTRMSPLDSRTIKDRVNSSSSFIEDDKLTLLGLISDDHITDTSNIIIDAQETAKTMFGDTDVNAVELTSQLYGMACNNLDNLQGITNMILEYKERYIGAYTMIVTNLQQLLAQLSNTMVNSNFDDQMSRMDRFYYSSVSTSITDSIANGIDALRLIINADYIIFTYKLNRCVGIVKDSCKVKAYAHELVAKFTGHADHAVAEQNIINVSDQIQDCFKLYEDTNLEIFWMNEILEENERINTEYSILLEADDNANNNGGADNNNQGNQNQQGNDNNQGNNNNNNQNNNQNNNVKKVVDKVKNKLNNIGPWLQHITKIFTTTVKKFQGRASVLVTKTGTKDFWKNNSQKLKNFKFDKVTVNDWYKFNIERITNPQKIPFPPFTATEEVYKSDKNLKDWLTKQLADVKYDEKDSYATIFTKCFQEKISNDKGGSTLGALQFNSQNAWTFCDNYISGKVTDAINKHDETIQKTINDFDPTKGKYKSILQQLQNAPQTNQESFDLAACLGLPKRRPLFEVDIKVDNDTAQDAANKGLNGEIVGNGDEEENKTKVLDDRIKRYVNVMIAFSTARMTSLVAAFKQYIALYKAIINSAKNANNQQNNNNQNNNNNNQNNNQQNNNNQQ